MSGWERKIIDAFISRYFASAPETGAERGVLRLRSAAFFPDFDSAASDEKLSYLEAAESLEQKGILKINWEKRGRGERIKTMSCACFEALFEIAGRPFPRTGTEEIRAMLGAKAIAFNTAGTEQIRAALEFLSGHFGPREAGQGMDRRVMEDFVRLLEFCHVPARPEITTRALSVLLYRDSKRLENILSLCGPLLSRAEKFAPLPDLSFLERSYPETMISGKIVIRYRGEETPLVNAGGHILGFPLESAGKIERIDPVSTDVEKTVLTIENKETFYALGTGTGNEFSRYCCFLYIGGYSNRAAAALLRVLSASGFSFYHAGDLDPDGILILRHIQDIARKPVTPVRMDTATFDQYRAWARTLTPPMLRAIKKIREDTETPPGMDGLLRRIEETGMGIEQEIIDYR